MRKYWWIVFILLIVVILGIGWYLASPLFIDNAISEDLPNKMGNVNNSLSILYEGNFVDANSFHKTSGKAIVFESDGNRYLRFENFQATNGPDLKVYLSSDLEAKDYVSLGDLKGNVGNQNYEIDENVNLDNYDQVLIWCEQFSVLFGNAQLN